MLFCSFKFDVSCNSSGLISTDSQTKIFSNIVTAAFFGKTKEFPLIFDFILSGVSAQE
jgi:hypothetical protein